ncbi:unnamed protein product [Arabis nemorensis]|uniref:Uncharacterized protein n=1 Tax=Arabis nemorensis TaxID=586526 RepID=A0A565CAH0_9BRAS|nr:unnamed protein product [Arabis nemorensis]
MALITSALVGLLLLALLLFLCLRRRRDSKDARTEQKKPAGATTMDVLSVGASSSKEEATGISSGMGGKTQRNKLVFTEGGVYRSVGTSYKAVLARGRHDGGDEAAQGCHGFQEGMRSFSSSITCPPEACLLFFMP